MRSLQLALLAALLSTAILGACGARSSLSPGITRAGSGGSGGSGGGEDACSAIACNTPPPASCVSATILRTSPAPGSCSAGACDYASVETECPYGCSAGACSALAKATMISAGNDFSCAVTEAGAVRCWGGNEYGQRGVGSLETSLVPVDVLGLSSGVVAVTAGTGSTCAVTSVGAVKCWGSNGYGDGQLGDGAKEDSLVPVDVVGLSSGVVAVSTGGRHACALTVAGAVKCWGANDNGELGNKFTVDSLVPADAVGLSSGVLAVGAGETHTCALTTTGAVKCWGFNASGQLGDGSTTQSYLPVDVVGLSSGVLSISVGSQYACAVRATGALECWGNNDFGQLGNGSLLASHVPVGVTGLTSGVVAVSASESHTCAVTATGAVRCWGRNGQGQLGDGTTTDSLAPVDVVGLPSGVLAVAAGTGVHTCAITSAGGISCWGDGTLGQLGNNSVTSSPVPVSVVGF